MKNIKLKYIILFIMTLFVFTSTKVYAASANISVSTTNAYVGDNVTINVNVFAGSWNLNVTGSVSASIVGYDEDANVTTNKSYTLDTSRPGTYTITLSGDITDYDSEVTTYPSQSVTVTVVERPVVQEVQPEPNKPATSNTNNNNYSNNSNKNNTATKKEEVVEEPKEEVVEEKKLNITKFEIVGYEILFSPDKYSYSIDVLDGVSDLYIIVEGEDIETTGTGRVSISGLNEITITVKYNEVVYNYKVKLNKVNPRKLTASVDNSVDESWTIREKILLSTTLIFGVSTFGLCTVHFVGKNKKKRLSVKLV